LDATDFDAVERGRPCTRSTWLGLPVDIARAIVFLLDPANSWITGQVLAVDGGLSRVRPRMKA
jgi:NAD(P)-dependent dehydrogenase (short-subunit alcohol dehydrogenase family)